MESAFGRGVGSTDESEHGRGVVEVEAYSEASEIGPMVPEDSQLPVDEQWGASWLAQEVARLQVVMEQHWLDGVVAGVDFLVEESGHGA